MLNFTIQLHAKHCTVLQGLSICPSISLSNAWIVTKRKKLVSIFLHHMKIHSSKFTEKKNGWQRRPLLAKLLETS